MASTFTVLADTRAAAAAELSRMCRLLDLEPLGAPKAVLGRDRWLARAVPMERPASGEQSACPASGSRVPD